MVNPNKENIIQLLREIPDPEIPVTDIWELGILRDVNILDNKVEVVITPTYSGCPAMKQIEDDIVSKLHENGLNEVTVKMIYNPPWTTDWITDEAKEKLRRYGIAPPEKTTVDKGALIGKPKVLACPHCGSQHTQMISQFGSTACKALYQCQDCMEPFDYFKCI